MVLGALLFFKHPAVVLVCSLLQDGLPELRLARVLCATTSDLIQETWQAAPAWSRNSTSPVTGDNVTEAGLLERRLRADNDEDHDDEVDRDIVFWIRVGISVGALTAFVVITLLPECAFAVFYQPMVTSRRGAFPDVATVAPTPMGMVDFPDFRIGLCSCFEDIEACLYGSFCGPVRVADTHAAAGIRGFWQVFLVYMAVEFFGAVLDLLLVWSWWGDEGPGRVTPKATQVLVGALLALYLGPKRGRLRELLGGTAEGSGCGDFLTWWLWPCCATIQEARQVDGASGVSVSCCCYLQKKVRLPPYVCPAVGLPVQVAAAGPPPPSHGGNGASAAAPVLVARTVPGTVTVVGAVVAQPHPPGGGKAAWGEGGSV